MRLSHPTARSGVFTFEHRKRPYRRYNKTLRRFEDTPVLCAPCGKAHAVKTYHVSVDAEGFAFVSQEVYQMMKRHNMAGFSVANEVGSPPTQTIGVGPTVPPQELPHG